MQHLEVDHNGETSYDHVRSPVWTAARNSDYVHWCILFGKVTMVHKFDERGEAAIINLRKDTRFNEALYRELGPMRYWTQVREAERRLIEMKNARGEPVLDAAGHLMQYPTKKEYENEMMKLGEGNGLPLEKASEKEHSKIVNAATTIVMIGAAFSITTIMIAIAAMICYGAWIWIF